MSRELISSRSPYFSWVRRSVAARLLVASRALPAPFRFLVTEGYRPLSLQRKYFHQHRAELLSAYPGIDDATLDDLASRYVAPPEVAAHPTGAAVDLMLGLADGSPVDMGSVLNATDAESSGACYTHSAFVCREAVRHREVLARAMTAAGFVNYPSEWWHWSYGDRYWAVVRQQPNAVYGPVEEASLEFSEARSQA
jgi:D-alanyl-D-alanine dipeptidase